MVRMSSKEDLNVPTYLIEHLLAIIKITNESPNLLQTQADCSTIFETIEDVRAYICKCAQEYEIIEEFTSKKFEDLINSFHFLICDHKLNRLCNLLLLFKKAQEIKLVSDTNERKTLEADEQKIIETAIQNDLFEHLKISHKLEEYAPLIVWNRSNPPTSFIYEKKEGIYTYAASNPRPISIDKSALKQMKNKEAEILKSQTYITNHLYKRLIQKGFVLPSPSRTKLKTKPACFIYDTLMFLGYFSNDYSIMNNKYRINKAKRDRIKEIIIFTK